MKLKLIAALAGEDRTEALVAAARQAGATGVTIVGSARGEGLEPAKTFLGLDFNAPCDLLLFLVVETRAREILEHLCQAGRFDEEPGAGIAFQLNIEDAVGLGSQMQIILDEAQEAL
ncbi:MAG: P-II family nitrogen regulator [Gammaproteobacteria bacterium]|nr:P-II family nitrogen regulator [Gammaproteobacteria bacterium]